MILPNPSARKSSATEYHRPSWLRRFPVAVFLGILVLSFCLSLFEESLPDGDQIEAARFFVVLLAALLGVGDQRKTRRWGFALVMMALAGKCLHHARPDLVSPAVFVVPGLLFVGVVIGHLLHFILRAPRVDSEVLCAGVATYLLLALLWAFAYVLLARFSPDAFAFSAGPASAQSMKGFTTLYFSCITQSTVGYGDIVPLSGTARTLAML